LKTRLLFALITVVLCTVPTAAFAMTHQFAAFLNGMFEVQQVTSPALGSATFAYDDVLHTLVSDVSFERLTGSCTAVQINNADFGFDGPLVFAFSSTNSPLTDTFVMTDAQANELFAERFYVNVYCNAYQTGELRGQIVAVPVPEPSSLIALATCGVAFLLRRKRK
jgi:hypothetical protein